MARILLDQKTIAEMSVGEGDVATVTPVPTLPVGPPLKVEKQCYLDFIKEHQKIRDMINRTGRNNECMSVEEMAAGARVSQEAITYHMDVMQIDNSIIPTSKNGEFCTLPILQKLVDKLHKVGDFIV